MAPARGGEEEKLEALLQESLAAAAKSKALELSDLARVIIHTTVRPKAVTHPTEAKLSNRAQEKLVRRAKQHGARQRQSYARLGWL